MNGAIINMAQDFIGSNNLNLLMPNGQFGTRLDGGKDAASPRYVFTQLMKITEMIFHPDDNALLEFQEDDGQRIEPKTYMPVIPMVLVNGSNGIGTGWSTSIPNYNPLDIIARLKALIEVVCDGTKTHNMLSTWHPLHCVCIVFVLYFDLFIVGNGEGDEDSRLFSSSMFMDILD